MLCWARNAWNAQNTHSHIRYCRIILWVGCFRFYNEWRSECQHCTHTCNVCSSCSTTLHICRVTQRRTAESILRRLASRWVVFNDFMRTAQQSVTVWMAESWLHSFSVILYYHIYCRLYIELVRCQLTQCLFKFCVCTGKRCVENFHQTYQPNSICIIYGIVLLLLIRQIRKVHNLNAILIFEFIPSNPNMCASKTRNFFEQFAACSAFVTFTRIYIKIRKKHLALNVHTNSCHQYGRLLSVSAIKVVD